VVLQVLLQVVRNANIYVPAVVVILSDFFNVPLAIIENEKSNRPNAEIVVFHITGRLSWSHSVSKSNV